MTDEQRLTDRLAELVADEPPFETDLGSALWAAEAGGRRRRRRSTAIRGTTVLLAAAATAAAALAIWSPPAARTLAPPAGTSPAVVSPAVVSPTTTKATTTTTTPTPISEQAALRRLATLVASQAGAGAAIKDDPGAPPLQYTAQVQAAGGPVEVSALKETNPDGLALEKQSCRLGAKDAKPCRTLVNRDAIGVFEATYAQSGMSGRRRLLAVAVTPDGGTLTVLVDNYLETPTGKKVIGPSWQQAGITVAGLQAAIADSGLALPD